MTLAILHLSDIHLMERDDAVLDRAHQIASALNPFLSDASAVVILLSGDIAQAGLQVEYTLAEEFLGKIISKIREEKIVPIRVIIAPGNHDCDFRGDQEARLAIISNIAKKAGNIPHSFIDGGIAVQKEFATFRAKFEADFAATPTDPLWRTYLIEVEGKRIYFDTLNASWMSTKHEKQGGLLFPFERYKEYKQNEADLRIVTLHHPLNWYSQVNYLPFRDFVHRLADFIFTGHEHRSGSRESDDANSGECIYIDGAALQTREDRLHSGFNVVAINPVALQYQYTPFKWIDDRYEPSSTENDWLSYRDLPKREPAEFELVADFRAMLHDPGATLKHPSGITLTLKDIYIFPDLDVRIDKRSEKIKGGGVSKLSARTLADPLKLKKDILIGGSESAGKTRLLYTLFDRYHEVGMLPLILKGKDIKRSNIQEIKRCIDNAISEQYGALNQLKFQQASQSKKILFIDDFTHSPIKNGATIDVLRALKAGFHRTIVTVGDNFELTEIFAGDSGISFAEYDQYQISALGYERRSELVRKWVSIGADETQSPNDVLKLIDDAENLIESTRVRHITPSVPIYVLSLLQASASGLSKELHSSSFAHYYYFLIVGALEKGGVKINEMAPYIAACTHLSWFIKMNGEEFGISSSEYERFVAGYSTEWTTTDPRQLLDVLVAARLIEVDGGAIRFAYPYSYYYFLGRYASISMNLPEVLEYLQYCMKHLYVRECANTLLFLAHHTGTSVVLDYIVKSISSHFANQNPMTFAKEDVKTVSTLMAAAPAIKYVAQKPADFRKKSAQFKDQQVESDGLIDKPSPKPDLFQDVVSLMKSIEIAGALLTHQFSNYQNAKKTDAIKQIFDGSMRAVREIFSLFERNTDELVASLVVRDRHNSSTNDEQAELRTRLAIGMLLRLIAAGLVNKAGVHLTSIDLAGHVDELTAANPTQAYRLIKISQHLQRPNRLPRLEIERLVREERDNPCVMGPLQLLVLQRMYMFETDFDDKDWAMATFGLGGAAKALELRDRQGPRKLGWSK